MKEMWPFTQSHRMTNKMHKSKEILRAKEMLGYTLSFITLFPVKLAATLKKGRKKEGLS